MKVKARILIIVLSTLLGMTVMAIGGLYNLRQTMEAERRTQITNLLEFADAQLKHFHALEVSGKLGREEAQARAKESIAAQRKGDDYFFIRTLTDDYFVYHPVASRMGKPDPGGMLPDGRTGAQALRDALAQSKNGVGFAIAYAPRPGDPSKTLR